MRHYEIVFMLHPDCGEQVINIINHYINMIVNVGGKVHRMENWGCRQLAYSIKKVDKAYYVLLNVEISKNMLIELNNDFKFNESIIRNIIIRTKQAIVDPSPMLNLNKKVEDQDCNNVTESNENKIY